MGNREPLKIDGIECDPMRFEGTEQTDYHWPYKKTTSDYGVAHRFDLSSLSRLMGEGMDKYNYRSRHHKARKWLWIFALQLPL